MKKKKYEINFRIPKELHQNMLDDLRRPHSFAAERIGFLHTRSLFVSENKILIIAISYEPVTDGDYINDPSVGAKFNSNCIRKAMQGSLDKQSGCFHVHLHDHLGKPGPSYVDLDSLPSVANSLANVARKQMNGFLIISSDGFYGEVKVTAEEKFQFANNFSVVGYPMVFQFDQRTKSKTEIYDRQSFLGKNAQHFLGSVTVGIVGYGGGGSHVGQQLAHLGVKNVIVFDNDKIEYTNLNRLIGAWFADVKRALLKTNIAKRVIKKILPTANVIPINEKWQARPEMLQRCDIIVGCVDSLAEREQLEAECRRYLIPYIDIGMDVFKKDGFAPSMSGQIILSMPGCCCMKCYGFLTEEDLGKEHAKYGVAGGMPQVVWANGVLASTAVGVLVDLITGWSGLTPDKFYLSYNGAPGTLTEHIRKRFAPNTCEHYPLKDAGPATFKKL